MAQHDYIISNATFPAVRTDINNALSAIQTTNSGTSRPTGAVAGQLWLDTTSATTPTLKYYDGADDISLATIDHTANTVNWLDSTVSITGLSTTATGTVLTLTDSANTTTVNLIIDNQKEIRFRETTANGTNYVALKAPASLASDLTFTLPATDGASGQALVTNGSGVLSFASAGTSWQSVKTSGFTAVSGEGYPCNTTSSAFTVTLPASPSVGSYVQIVDYAGTFATNNITLGANSNKINGGTSNKTLTTNREAVTITYVDSTQGWVASSGVNYGTVSLDPVSYSINYLIVAGGGGGASDRGGAGGAGGLLSGSTTVTGGTTYTVTVGAGGAFNGSGSGALGGDSSITSMGSTSLGGGGGASIYGSNTTISGGSGGGGSASASYSSAGSGTSGQGNNGGTGGTGGVNNGGGGGGGSSSVGSVGNSSTGGNGGSGSTTSLITTTQATNNSVGQVVSSSVYFSGGGGGGKDGTSGTGGTGGNGGGANGGQGTNLPTSASVNSGGGGGGGGGIAGTIGGVGTNGGSGCVILSMPTSNYSGTTTGSPTVVTNGSNTVIIFKGTGSYTS